MIINGLTYDSTTKRLTLAYVASDLTRGGTALNPYVVQDIYDTCIAKGWAGLDKLGNNYIFNEVGLYVSGNTYFDISNAFMLFHNTPHNSYFETSLTVQLTGTNFSIGNADAGTKYCRLYANGSNTSILKNGFIRGLSYCYLQGIKIRNTKITGFRSFGQFAGAYLDKCTLTLGQLGFRAAADGVTNRDLSFVDGQYTIFIRSLYAAYNVVLRGAELINNARDLYYFTSGKDNYLTLIDCLADPESYSVNNTSTHNALTTFKTTFRWKFDADVKVYDKDENLIIDKTVAMDDEDEVIFCEHHFTVEPELALEVSYKQPFKVVVSKKGFETIAILDNEVVLGQKTVIRAELKKAIEVMATNKGIAIKANKTNYGKNRDFAIIP
ncbi:MAG: hypothetical protein PHS05_09395 [Bacteroidales bacterium]|nr:hypothetical protein [Bacteroidales bacterium]